MNLPADEINNAYSICQAQILKLKKYVKQKAAEKDSQFLTSLFNEQKIENKLSNIKTQRFRLDRKLIEHFGKVYALRWSPKGNEILSASQDCKLLIFNAGSGSKRMVIPLNQSWVMACAWSPSSDYVACGGLDNMVNIYHVKDLVGYFASNDVIELIEHEMYTSSIQFLDDNQVFSSSGDGTVKLWDINRKKSIRTFDGHHGDIEDVAINKEKSLFLCASIDSNIYLHDYRTKMSAKPIGWFSGHLSDVNRVKWFPDNIAFFSGSDDSTIRLWDLRSIHQLNVYQDPNIVGSVTSIDCSKSGYYIFGGYDDDPYALVWNTLTSTRETTLDHCRRVSCMELSPEGEYLATGCWDKILRLWTMKPAKSIFAEKHTCFYCYWGCLLCCSACLRCQCCN